MWLRLRLPQTVDEMEALIGPEHPASLPPPPSGDVRAVPHQVPHTCNELVAEFLGMFVADGTLYHSGFRLKKRYRSSVSRFSDLCYQLFAYSAEVRKSKDEDSWHCEVNSTLLSAWLAEIGGLEPHKKDVPEPVLLSGCGVRAAFLSGLFEDGTVNVRDNGAIDHVSLSTVRESVARKTQIMLLQQGITCRRFRSANCWRVDISGLQAKLFAERIGFSNAEKQRQLFDGHYAKTDRMRSIPVSYEQASALHCPWAKQNGRYRGHISRMKAEQEPSLKSALAFHHVRIKEIIRTEGPAMCLTVPNGSRFLQNGFDGCNSKGLEWDHVKVIDTVQGRFPCSRAEDYEEELRLLYVAITRARKTCTVSYSRETSDFIDKLQHILEGEKHAENCTPATSTTG
jgi:hypothetical protein